MKGKIIMTRTINMTNIENKHKTYTYNLKNENDVKITNLFTNFLDSIKIKISGNTLSISVLEPMGPVLKFTNISNLKDINLNVYQKQDAHANPDYLNQTFQSMIDDVWASNPENVDYWTIKNRTLTGTNFDDDIDITDPSKYTVVDGIGWTVNSLKGNDTIEGTTGKDTITGGLGKDTIVFSEGNDLVKLTKNEELVIDVSALGLNTPEDITRAQGDIQASTNKNGDLILTMLNEEDTQHQITINKFVKTNGVGAKGKVSLYLGKNEETQDVYYDLNSKAIMYFEEEDASFKKKSNTATLTGTRLGDDISIDGGTINALNNADNAKVTIKAGDGNNFINLINALNTNTITTGAGDDVIEIEDTSDITESTPKALTTVKAGAGQNKITIGGAGNNSIITGKDNDTFEISGESMSTLKAGGGNNIIKINDDSFGTITLAEEKIKNTKNAIVFDEGVHLMAAYKSGDNLILKTGDSSLIINNYFLQTGKNAVKTLDGYELANLGDFLEKNGLSLSVQGTKKITGTDLSETIMGSDKADTINANGGADEITGGKGKDTINAGAGNNKIIYHTGDGNDTILYGGADATDTLVFDNGMTVSAKYSGKNLLVDYTGKDYTGKDVKNTITIKNFKTNHSVQYVQIGEDVKTIDEIINGGGGGGDTTTYTVNDDRYGYDPLVLSGGHNNKVIFSNEYDDCYITSNNTSAYTDTLEITNVAISDKNYISEVLYDSNDTTLTIDTYDTDNNGGYIMYTAANNPNIVIKDTKATYNFSGYKEVKGTSDSRFTLADGNNIVYIKAQTGTSYVASNDDNNVIKTEYGEHGSGLNYLYGGGKDVICTASSSNDVYTATIDGNTSVVIYDADGQDTINANGENVRVIFDAGKTTTFKTNGVFIDKTVLSNMTTEEFKNIFSTTKGMNIAEMNITDVDTLNVNGSAITFDNWSIDSNNVHQAVAGWLTDNSGYTSVADALEKCTDADLLASLKTCFVDGTYNANA